MRGFEAVEIGHVVSDLRDVAAAPRQPDDGAPVARLLFKPSALKPFGVETPLAVGTYRLLYGNQR